MNIPVRFRIIILYASLVMLILGLVCVTIYYFSSQYRLNNMHTRLTNRATTTARLLGEKEIFDQNLLQRIDSLTTLSLKYISVQAYNESNQPIYRFSELPDDTLRVTPAILAAARSRSPHFFTQGSKEAIALYYRDNNIQAVVVSGAEDLGGKRNLASLKQILILSFLIGSLVVWVSGFFFSRLIVRPLQKITREVDDISARHLTQRIDTGKTKDEWHALAATFNQLLDRLQDSFEMQRTFISNASHELSTPLTSILSQLEVTLQRERSQEVYQDVLSSIHQDVKHMTMLTQTLLAFAKASGDRGGLEISQVRIDDILMRLPKEIARLREGYVVKLRFDEMPEDEKRLVVTGNEALLVTAFRNIVINACKYSEDSRANVHMVVKEKEIRISVEDKGKGIPDEDLKTIFQPFYRVEDSGDGFGLGLSLTEKIIRLHKGRISVQSEVGKGSVFTIVLPSSAS
jgi:signal transduction histidine kinase